MIAALPRPVQRQAQAQAMRVAMLNPLGASITFGQVMYLLALHYGAGDTMMALLYASLNITGLLALLGPWLLAGLDTSTVQYRAWLARAIASLALLALPFLASDAIKVVGLVVLVYVMMAARTVGVLANASVHKAICPGRELSSFSAKVFTRWNGGVLATTTLCFAVLHWQALFPSEEWAFMSLMAFGVVFNFATAGAMRGMPRTGTITSATPFETLAGFREAWRRASSREVIWLTMLQMPIGLSAAFQLNYLTQVLGMSSGMVFLLALGGVLASLLATRILAVVGGRISNRALWFGLHALLALVAIAWCSIDAVPLAARSGTCSVLWVVAAAALSGSTAIYASMLSERLPHDDSVRISAVFQTVGVFATVLGLLVLFAVRWAIDVLALPGTHAYTHAFALWALLSLAVCAFSLRLARGARTVDLLAQLTPGNLSTIFRAHQLRTEERDTGPAQSLEREDLMAAGTPAGRDLVLETLRSPDAWHRLAALRAVRAAPFAAALPAVLAEAEDRESALRAEAITTLGFVAGSTAIPALRRISAETDPWLVSIALKSLARLGSPPSVAEILRLYAVADSPRVRNELLIALAVMRAGPEIHAILATAMRAGQSAGWQDAVALYAAQAHGGREILRAVLAAEDERIGAGLEEAIALLAERDADAAERARQAASDSDWSQLGFGLPVQEGRQAAIATTLHALAVDYSGRSAL
jgi:hypothetical protein